MDLEFKFIENSMDSIWTGPWNPYGMVYSMDIPYGIHGGYGMKT